MIPSKIARALASSLIALSLNTQAGTQATVTYQTRPMMSIYYAEPGEKIFIEKETSSLYEISEAYKTGVESAFQYWADLLGPEAKNDLTGPVPVTVITYDQTNADAVSVTTINGKAYLGVNTFCDIINGKTKASEGRKDQSFIRVGKYLGANASGLDTQYGWYIDSSSALPQNEAAGDFVSVLRHELGHALGISTQKADLCRYDTNDKDSPLGFWVTDISQSVPKSTFVEVSALNETFLENKNCTEDADGNSLWREWKAITDSTGYYEYYEIHGLETNAFAHGLYDSNGVAAFSDAQSIASKLVVTPEMFTALNAANSNQLKSTDYFILDPEGSAYFSGSNVQKVLVSAGNGTLSTWAIPNQSIYGIPINGWECEEVMNDGYQNAPELSHFKIETLMSHENYRNYTTFTEVELAALQDIGYLFDRKEYFGFSIYSDGGTFTNSSGYSARKTEGVNAVWDSSNPNKTAYGVGLHIYGSHNTVTQVAKINTEGLGAIGIRVDGSGNQLTIPSGTLVASNGLNGMGVLFSAGSDHVLTVSGTVTATHATGNALQFDYGSNILGAAEYRGSWIRYCRRVDSEGNFLTGTNESISGTTLSQAVQNLNGALLDEVTIEGTIQGGNNAIYIAKNAYVEEITIKPGANIKGNITSDWTHFGTDYDAGEGLCIQYAGTSTPYSKAIEQLGLYTTLHFANENYAGNITGIDNIAVAIENNLTYQGTSAVRSWEVQSDKTLTLSQATIAVSKAFVGGNLAGSNSTLLVPTALALDGKVSATTNKVQGLNVTVYGTRDDMDAAHPTVFHRENGLYQALKGDVRQNQTTVTMGEGYVVGETTTTDGVTFHEKENARNRQSVEVLNPVSTVARIEVNDIRKRLGEVRSLTAPRSAWARYDGAKLEGDVATTRFNKIQCGFDNAFNPAWRGGLAFSYTDANVRADRARNDLGVFSLAAYGIYQHDNGFFTDLIGRIAFNHNRMRIDSDRVSLDTATAGFSAEAGWRFNLGQGAFVEPQLEASYSITDGGRYTISKASYKLDSSDSLLGRAGLAAGLSFATDGVAYLRGSLVHEFLGKSTLCAGNGVVSRRIASEGKDTWVEYGLGVNYWVNQRTYVYADLERTAGAKTDTQYRVSLGIRHAF